ncbi:uncharacterized protein LOC113384988 [Ctenocephalides felis]|uniref:uncharacterized protein LOC113384988 n=1 Tax=Ctenocephalides felis TaxID=7515 RepID=UPI000E6E2FFB|nr:uncharacterized protein LOC113384988 [Ctenocephalides felis]
MNSFVATVAIVLLAGTCAQGATTVLSSTNGNYHSNYGYPSSVLSQGFNNFNSFPTTYDHYNTGVVDTVVSSPVVKSSVTTTPVVDTVVSTPVVKSTPVVATPVVETVATPVVATTGYTTPVVATTGYTTTGYTTPAVSTGYTTTGYTTPVVASTGYTGLGGYRSGLGGYLF